MIVHRNKEVRVAEVIEFEATRFVAKVKEVIHELRDMGYDEFETSYANNGDKRVALIVAVRDIPIIQTELPPKTKTKGKK